MTVAKETLTVLVDRDFKRDLRIVAAKRHVRLSDLVRNELGKLTKDIRESTPQRHVAGTAH